MPEIENYSVYNDRMRRSMWDKAFFMDKVPGTELIVDYGCADGSLIRFLHSLFPTMCFIGFDIDPAMIEAANRERSENTWFFSDAEEMLHKIRSLGRVFVGRAPCLFLYFRRFGRNGRRRMMSTSGTETLT